MLTVYICYVDRTYTDTRHVSANAVKAGTAYENIVKAINNARLAADKAIQAADEAVINVSTVREEIYSKD
jgi:hypothetical protein